MEMEGNEPSETICANVCVRTLVTMSLYLFFAKIQNNSECERLDPSMEYFM